MAKNLLDCSGQRQHLTVTQLLRESMEYRINIKVVDELGVVVTGEGAG